MGRSVRVCMVNGTSHPVVGGVEQHMLRLADRMRAEGRDVLVVTYRIQKDWRARETVNGGIPVIRTGGLYLHGKLRRRWGLATLPMLLALIRNRKRYDIIHVHEMLESAFVAITAGKLLRKPVVMILACAGENSEMNILRRYDGIMGRFMVSRILKSRAYAAATSSDCERDLLECGIPASRIRRIPYGVDTSAFSADMNGHWHDPSSARTVVCVARLVPQKAHSVLLDAWQQVIVQVPTARLKLLGDGPLRGELETRTMRLGITDSVEFVGITNEVSRHLAHAGIFALPSHTEGLPNALLEAMSAGLACVATRVPGSRDLIHSGQTGLLVEPGDAPELASALLTFLRNPSFAQACGQNARNRIETDFSFDTVTAKYDRLYTELVGTHH